MLKYENQCVFVKKKWNYYGGPIVNTSCLWNL